MLSARVEREKAEAFRKELSSLHLVDTKVLIIEDKRFVLIPLAAMPSQGLLREFGATLEDASFPPRKSKKDPIDLILDVTMIPVSLKPALPRKWEQFGDVLVLRLDHSLDRYEAPVAKAYASVLGAKTVLRDVGGISGILGSRSSGPSWAQTQSRRILRMGSSTGSTLPRSCSPRGTVEERTRMAETRCDDETIVDMFAGIGYFSIPLAVYQKPRKVIACELNPIAHSFLVENIGLNKVGHAVDPILGDNRQLEGDSFADRVIMGYVKTTHEFLPAALRLVKDRGMIHYHDVSERTPA